MLLVLTTIAASFIAVLWHLEQYEQDGYLINLSGRQRMLSQRIALLATQYDSSGDQQSEIRQQLTTSVEKMATAHQTLLKFSRESESLSPKIDALDAQVRKFVILANEVIANDQARSLPALTQLISMSTDGDLLSQLDLFVQSMEHEYNSAEDEYNASVSGFKMVLQTLSVLCIAILLAISFGIFRPMLDMVTTNLDRLEASNTELTEFSYRISHDLRSPVVAALGITEVAKCSLQDNEVDAAA